MVEKRIQNTILDRSPNENNALEVEGVGQEIQVTSTRKHN